MANSDDRELKRLGRRLRALREAQGLTQEQVAEKAGCAGKYISEVERGRRNVSVMVLRNIVEGALGLQLADALSETSNKRQAIPAGAEMAIREIMTWSPMKRRRVLALVKGILHV